MAESKGCSCGSVFLINILVIGGIIGLGGFFVYKYLKEEIAKQQP